MRSTRRGTTGGCDSGRCADGDPIPAIAGDCVGEEACRRVRYERRVLLVQEVAALFHDLDAQVVDEPLEAAELPGERAKSLAPSSMSVGTRSRPGVIAASTGRRALASSWAVGHCCVIAPRPF